MKRTVRKYAPNFKGTEILPVLELVAEVESKIQSYIITDLKTGRLAGIKQETFEELLKSAGIPCRDFCDDVSLLGMSCCPRRSWPGAISPLKNTSGSSLNTKVPGKLK